MIPQTQHIALSILLISLISLNNNNDSLFFYTSATSDVTSNTLNTRLRSSTNLRINSNSAVAKGKDNTKIISDINGKSRRELQEDVVDQREDSIEGQEELFISQNCLNLLAGKFLLICVYCVLSGGMHIAVDWGAYLEVFMMVLEIVYALFVVFMWLICLCINLSIFYCRSHIQISCTLLQ